MGTTTVVLTPEVSINQWSGVDANVRAASQVPRGEVRFTLINGVIPAPAAGNDGVVTIDCQFPQNFAYVFGEMTLKIDSLLNNLWQNHGQILMLSSSPRATAAQQTFNTIQSPGSYMQLEGRSGEKIWTPVGNSQLTYKADRNGANVSMSVQIGNPTEDHEAATANFFARFFIYDLEQANHYQVNSPTLVRATH